MKLYLTLILFLSAYLYGQPGNSHRENGQPLRPATCLLQQGQVALSQQVREVVWQLACYQLTKARAILKAASLAYSLMIYVLRHIIDYKGNVIHDPPILFVDWRLVIWRDFPFGRHPSLHHPALATPMRASWPASVNWTVSSTTKEV